MERPNNKPPNIGETRKIPETGGVLEQMFTSKKFLSDLMTMRRFVFYSEGSDDKHTSALVVDSTVNGQLTFGDIRFGDNNHNALEIARNDAGFAIVAYHPHSPAKLHVPTTGELVLLQQFPFVITCRTHGGAGVQLLVMTKGMRGDVEHFDAIKLEYPDLNSEAGGFVVTQHLLDSFRRLEAFQTAA